MNLDITNDEVIILWNFLRRYSSEEVLVIEDQAEQRTLWNLECVFEKEVNKYFDGNWDVALKNALTTVRDENGTNSVVELEKGRLALWLEPKEIELILSQWRSLPDDSSTDMLESWGKLAFRCNSALHKANLK